MVFGLGLPLRSQSIMVTRTAANAPPAIAITTHPIEFAAHISSSFVSVETKLSEVLCPDRNGRLPGLRSASGNPVTEAKIEPHMLGAHHVRPVGCASGGAQLPGGQSRALGNVDFGEDHNRPSIDRLSFRRAPPETRRGFAFPAAAGASRRPVLLSAGYTGAHIATAPGP